FFFSSRRRHTRFDCDWSSDVCSSDLGMNFAGAAKSSPSATFTIYAASWDGMLHQLNVADGEDLAAPAKFMPPNGKPYALNLVNRSEERRVGNECSARCAL